jgi:hypothetical protein
VGFESWVSFCFVYVGFEMIGLIFGIMADSRCEVCV